MILSDTENLGASTYCIVSKDLLDVSLLNKFPVV